MALWWTLIEKNNPKKYAQSHSASAKFLPSDSLHSQHLLKRFINSTRPTRPSTSSAQRPRPSPRRQQSVENDYPELSGDFALRGAAPNAQLCAPDGDGAALDGSNGNVLQNSQVGK